MNKFVATDKIRNSIQQPNMGEIRVIRLPLVKQLEKYFASKVFCLKTSHCVSFNDYSKSGPVSIPLQV